MSATGIECNDETVAFIKKWRRRDNKVGAVSFKIKDPKSIDATWVVDVQSTAKTEDGKKVSLEDQFNEVRDSMKKYQNRVWLAKVEYEKAGADLSAIVYLLRRGQTKASSGDETKKQKRLRKMCFQTRMVYASSGAAIKSNVSTKHSAEYDHYDISYADLQESLAKKI